MKPPAADPQLKALGVEMREIDVTGLGEPKPEREHVHKWVPTDVRCPKCDAAPETPCYSVGPDSYARGAPLTRPHAERYAAARGKHYPAGQ
jgi:hypothetical protein